MAHYPGAVSKPGTIIHRLVRSIGRDVGCQGNSPFGIEEMQEQMSTPARTSSIE